MRLLTSAFLIVILAWEVGALGKEKPTKPSQKAASFNVPIPVGHGATGVKIPYYSESGQLQMNFQIDRAQRLDEIHLQMSSLNLETFNEAGQQEMTILLPQCVLDLRTRVLSSSQPGTIKRKDFELTGDTLQFDTVTRQGALTGNIRMLIFDLNEISNTKPK